MKLSPQCQTIFDHLLRGGTISTMEAMRDFGCCRLSERIRELESTGIVIDRERVKIGRKTYTRYSYHTLNQHQVSPVTIREYGWVGSPFEHNP